MKKTLRKILPVLALVLVVAVASVGGTIAWLTDKTQEVKNTFTVGDVDIDLKETGTTKDGTTGNESKEFKIIPGTNLVKDPTVTVKANSEACWLFVKVDVQNWPPFKEDGTETSKVKYEIDTGWTKLTGVEGIDNVYYREVSSATSDQVFDVLKTLATGTGTPAEKYTVLVSENLTKAEANEIGKDGKTPTMTFTAYAVQKDNVADAATAWNKVSGT